MALVATAVITWTTATWTCNPPRASAAWHTLGSGPGRGLALTLPAVASVTATCSIASTASLTWPAATYATGYTVQRSSSLGSWSTLTTTTSPSASTSLTGLSGLSVRWRIIATNQSWTAPTSPPSNTLTISALAVCT
jgi:hypothetical protein